MTGAEDDPFARHPGLRALITPPEQSQHRDLSIAKLEALLRAHDLPLGWWYPDAEREAMRAADLDGLRDRDLWVFAYGSLMWDPGFRFAEVRRAVAPRHVRRFILKDIYGGRGTPERPGLMAALDEGDGCEGLAFRIPRALIEPETEILWRRERICPGYHTALIPLDADGETLEAVAFVADHDAELIEPGLTREEQVRYLATGAGFFGTSLDYIRRIELKFLALAVHDPEVTALRAEAEAYRAAPRPPLTY
jgi:cation transport protein ChaC